MHSFLLQIFDYLNTIILIYFVITNGTYTVLMVLSLYTVTLHSRYASRRSYYAQLAESPVTPPVALVVPAFNEQDAIVATVLSLMDLQYPEKEIIVVDDGSTDSTVQRLIEQFGLLKMDLIYRPVLAAKPVTAFYHNPRYPELIVLSKENGGKPDAVNVGINMARSSYFCTVDADSIIEREAPLRLIAPVRQPNVSKVVSGGVVPFANG